MASRPVGSMDYLLAAIQGVVSFLALLRAANAGAHSSAGSLIGVSFLLGPLGGLIGLFLFAAIYRRLGVRAGGAAPRSQVVHVLAYGGLPVAASLGLWLVCALLAGGATFVETPPADLEGFVVFLLHAQFAAYIALWLWSILLQVMGFSEIQGITLAKALWVWVFGQLVAVLGALFLNVLIGILVPGVAPH